MISPKEGGGGCYNCGTISGKNRRRGVKNLQFCVTSFVCVICANPILLMNSKESAPTAVVEQSGGSVTGVGSPQFKSQQP